MPVAPAALDADSLDLCQDLAGRLFPWDINRALELALLKTFCLPSISGLLERSGEFEQRPRKRYDDTALIVAELLRLGPDSPGGRAVIQRLNRIHGHYAISQADYAYVLSGFVAEPIRWLQRYGWRPLSGAEQQALFRFWDHVGALMGLSGRPASLDELLALNARVEGQLFRAASSNRRIADATLAMLVADLPAPLRAAAGAVLRGLLEPPVLDSLGWPPSPPWLAALLRGGLRLRSRLLSLRHRHLPPGGRRFYSERPTPSYGARFQLEQLGPPPLLERLNNARWRGSQRRIGLTGGIASGKSTVARLLAERHGLPVLDADAFAREALAPGSQGARAVLARYGDRVRLRDSAQPAPAQTPWAGTHRAGTQRAGTQRVETPDTATGVDRCQEAGAIDRAALGRIVFADPAERRWLEELVHPLVRQRFAQELQRLEGAPVVVLMIPLLFEAGLEGLCSEVWLVDCPEPEQLRRLMTRDGMSEAEAHARLAAQWPLERKRPLADALIDNGGEPRLLESQLLALLGGRAAPGAGSQGG